MHWLSLRYRTEVPRNDTSHVALVIFVWTKYVEEFQADVLGWQRFTCFCQSRKSPGNNMLAPAISVQRAKPLESAHSELVIKARGAVTISSGRRCVNDS